MASKEQKEIIEFELDSDAWSFEEQQFEMMEEIEDFFSREIVTSLTENKVVNKVKISLY